MDASAHRLVHSEADEVPGFAVEKYGERLVLQVGSAAIEKRLAAVVGVLDEMLDPSGILL